MRRLFWKILFLLFCSVCLGQRTLHIKYEWKKIDYVFPDDNERQNAIREGRFSYQNCTPIDVDVFYGRNGKTKTFVTFPRIGDGIPVTLGTVSQQSTPDGPLIEPYPSYAWHKSYGRNCEGITSVFRVFIDHCERLWLLDTGRIGSETKCNPQLLVFDLNTDVLIHRYRIPSDQYDGSTLLVTPMVNIFDGCNEARVYMADTGGSSMIVYDTSSDSSWKIFHDSFKPTDNFDTFTVEGKSFRFKGGIFGLSFQREISKGKDDRLMYYHSFSSPYENSVPISVLNDANSFRANPKAHSSSFKRIGDRGDVQTVAQAMDSKGNLFFGLMTPSAVACWDSKTPYIKDNLKLIARHRETLQFASGVKVIKNREDVEELWVITNKFQHRFSATYDWTKFNFRILARPINEILKGKTCGLSGTNLVGNDAVIFN